MEIIDQFISPESPLRYPLIALLFLTLFGILTLIYRQIIKIAKEIADDIRVAIINCRIHFHILNGGY